MALLVEEYIDTAEKYLGYSERDHGGATKFGQWFGDRQKNSAYDKAAWCDMFLAYCGWETAGEEGLDVIGEYAYTPHHASWFARNGRWGNTPTRGAIGFIDWNGSRSIPAIDHVVLVLGTDSRGRIATIEGNTSDEVKKCKRERGIFVGFGYPRYGKVPVPTTGGDDKPVKRPVGRPKIGTNAPKFPLSSNEYFSVNSHNGYSNAKDRDSVRRIQTRLRERGWRIETDGYFGQKTHQIVSAYQDEKSLEKDGKVGRITWASLWQAPITQ
ncbi:peptidoglycan-binding protein [Nonomuraea jabiensis]|uniref:C40 family peptidase n=1 Tax=Nonomuraea jabiensis TaxID=882448 RepID=UPI0034255E43